MTDKQAIALVAILLPLTLGVFVVCISAAAEQILSNLYVLPKVCEEFLEIKNKDKRRM